VDLFCLFYTLEIAPRFVGFDVELMQWWQALCG